MVKFLGRFVAGMLGLALLMGSLVGGYWLGSDWDFASRAVASRTASCRRTCRVIPSPSR